MFTASPLSLLSAAFDPLAVHGYLRMFQNDVNNALLVVPSNPWLKFALLAMSIPLLTYTITSIQSAINLRSNKVSEPPIVPYFIPFLGNLLPFLLSPSNFTSSITRSFGYTTPVRVRLGPLKAYIVHSAAHYDTFLRAAKDLRSDIGVVFTLRLLFKLPAVASKFQLADDSGIHHTPNPGSKTARGDRIHYHRYAAATKFLMGPYLKDMTERFVWHLRKQVAEAKDIQDEWVEIPDLSRFLRRELFFAATYSLVGPNFLGLTPSLNDDFWEFIDCIPVHLKGIPRICSPKAHRKRDRALEGVKRYHRHAVQHAGLVKSDDPIWDEHWGAKIMKERYTYSENMEAMTLDARASEDLTLLFAMNANAVPATIWFILELIRDPTLLARVRNEVEEATLPATPDGPAVPDFDLTKLCSGQLLQSAYAETLRLYMAAGLFRIPSHKDYVLGKWRFPRDGLILMSSRTAHHNEETWNAGTPEEPHPLNKFWADRFLVFPNDPTSGPLKKRSHADDTSMTRANQDKDHSDKQSELDKPKFSMEGLAGSWVPYGGGQHLCPGRFFAKNEMMAAFALISSAYEIELLNPELKLEPDMAFFPIGMLPPKGKIPVRMRRRQVTDDLGKEKP